MKLRRRKWVKRVAIGLLLLFVAAGSVVGFFAYRICWMPGTSYVGPMERLTLEEVETRERLRSYVATLATEIGERHWQQPRNYQRAEEFIIETFRQMGYEPQRLQAWRWVSNVQGELPGREHAEQVLVIGAHYDTVRGAPGANDNGSGVAAMLEVARLLRGKPLARTVRFVAFYNEENVSPSGARRYAEECRRRQENIIGVICLDDIGYYSDRPDTQKYPFPFNLFYPSRGNFIAFVGNSDSRELVHDAIRSFRANAKFPSKGAAMPSFFPDAGRSDHQAFWQQGYRGLMVTDTANFRYPYYHTPKDTIDKVDFDRTARVTVGLAKVIENLADEKD